MRILKPLYVSPLVTPFDDGKRIHCIVTALLHVSFDGQLRKDQELWFYANQETEGMVVDEGKPKVGGEWLVHGACYARKPGVGMSFAKATVAGHEKVLAVFGPRQWTTGGPSDPQPFEVMPLRFTHAFGGPDFADNPTGTGHGGTPPPNVEVRGSFVTTPRDKPPVAGFGRLDPQLPTRMKKMGTYDDRWMKTRFPGVAEDFDPAYFNLALPDQRQSEPFAGDESFSFVNMHPDREVVSGKLPGIIGRAFVKRKGEGALVDVRMHIDTVVFYPHRERLVLVCRGATRTRSDTLSDIEEVGLGVEWIDRPKSYEHYLEALAVKRRRWGGMKRLDDTALVPEGNPAPAPKERIKTPGDGLAQRQIERSVAHLVSEMRRSLQEHDLDTSALDKIPVHVDSTVDPDDIPELGPPPTMESVKAQIAAETEAAIAKARASLTAEEGEEGDRAREAFAKAAVALRTGPVGPPAPSLTRARADIQEQLDALALEGADTKVVQAHLDDPKVNARMKEIDRSRAESYRTIVHFQQAAPRLGREASAELRARAMDLVKKKESFAFVDLTGADLSGLDLRGARMSWAYLESADLTGADLEGADLDNAVLARARLGGTRLAACHTLVGANLSEADLTGLDLSGLDLTGCFFVGADLTRTRLVGATLDNADFGKATLRATDFSESRGRRLFFHKMRLEDVVVRGAKWERPLFYESEVHRLDARGAEIPKLGFVDTIVEDSIFDDAILLKLRAARALGTTAIRRCSFVGTTGHKAFFRALDMTGSSFRHAVMKEADFSEAVLDGSDFQDAQLAGARFMDASLKRCCFDRADLLDGLLAGAIMDHATFESANLFRADFARVLGDTVSMKGANVKFVRTTPRREEPR